MVERARSDPRIVISIFSLRYYGKHLRPVFRFRTVPIIWQNILYAEDSNPVEYRQGKRLLL